MTEPSNPPKTPPKARSSGAQKVKETNCCKNSDKSVWFWLCRLTIEKYRSRLDDITTNGVWGATVLDRINLRRCVIEDRMIAFVPRDISKLGRQGCLCWYFPLSHLVVPKLDYHCLIKLRNLIMVACARNASAKPPIYSSFHATQGLVCVSCPEWISS